MALCPSLTVAVIWFLYAFLDQKQNCVTNICFFFAFVVVVVAVVVCFCFLWLSVFCVCMYIYIPGGYNSV